MEFQKKFDVPKFDFINTGPQPGGSAGPEDKAVLTAFRVD
jgi:hypothetical protein